MVISITAFCTQADVKRLFSTSGVNARLDDVCELQKVIIAGTPTSGTYTLTYSGSTTPAINYNDGQVAVQAALREIDALNECEVTTTGTTPNFTHRIKFVSVTGDASLLTASSSLAGGTPTITISEVQAGSSTALDDAIVEACDEIMSYLFKFYSATALGGSNLISQWTKVLAASNLSRRRGNPKLFMEDAERIRTRLEAIANQQGSLANIPKRRSLAPTWDNQRADARYQFKVLRNETSTSSQQQSTQTQNLDYTDQFSNEW